MNKKSVFQTCVYLFSSLALVLFLVSCGPPNEKAHPAYQQGVKKMNDGEYEEAVRNFEKYLSVNYNSSLTHNKLAIIYNDFLDEPFYAIYHYRYYLKLEPDASDKDMINAWIVSAEKKMVQEIREKNPDLMSEEEILELKKNNAKYRELLVKLKNKNAAMRKKLNSGRMISSKVRKKGKSKKTNSSSLVISGTYKVAQGDNLSVISRKVYGSSKHYKLIFDANRDVLESEAKLKIGQELRIPKLDNKRKESKPKDITPPEEEGFPGVITD